MRRDRKIKRCAPAGSALRTCLKCERGFWSSRPKSENRRCPACEVAVNLSGVREERVFRAAAPA